MLARGGRGEEGKGGIFPLPITSRAFLFPSPQSPYDTKRPLRRREAKLQIAVGPYYIGCVVYCIFLSGPRANRK